MADEPVRSRREKIIDRILDTLITGLVVGWFAFTWNQSRKVDEVDNKVAAQSLVDKQIIEDIAEFKAEFYEFKKEITNNDPFMEPIEIKSAAAIREEIQQGIDKEIYRSKELKR